LLLQSITPDAWHWAWADEMFFSVAIAADSLADDGDDDHQLDEREAFLEGLAHENELPVRLCLNR